jgi:hypothetical protein
MEQQGGNWYSGRGDAFKTAVHDTKRKCQSIDDRTVPQFPSGRTAMPEGRRSDGKPAAMRQEE